MELTTLSLTTSQVSGVVSASCRGYDAVWPLSEHEGESTPPLHLTSGCRGSDLGLPGAPLPSLKEVLWGMSSGQGGEEEVESFWLFFRLIFVLLKLISAVDRMEGCDWSSRSCLSASSL